MQLIFAGFFSLNYRYKIVVMALLAKQENIDELKNELQKWDSVVKLFKDLMQKNNNLDYEYICAKILIFRHIAAFYESVWLYTDKLLNELLLMLKLVLKSVTN